MTATVTVLPTSVRCECGHSRSCHAGGGKCIHTNCRCERETLPHGLLTTAQMIAATGVTYRQIDFWVRTGLLPNDTARGSGSQRSFTEAEVQIVCSVRALLDAGFVLAKAFEIARALTERSLYVGRFAGVSLAVIVDSPATAGDPQ